VIEAAPDLVMLNRRRHIKRDRDKEMYLDSRCQVVPILNPSLVNIYRQLRIISVPFALFLIIFLFFVCIHDSILGRGPPTFQPIKNLHLHIISHPNTFPYLFISVFTNRAVLGYISHKPKMCFTEPSHSSRHGKRYYKEEREVVIAPRPVKNHHHHTSSHRSSYSGTPARTSYTQVTRTVAARPANGGRVTYVPSPRQSTNSYRRSGPVIVEQQRRSTQYIR